MTPPNVMFVRPCIII